MTLPRTALPLIAATALGACDGGYNQTSNIAGTSATAASSPAVALGQTGNANGINFTVTGVTTPSQIGPAGIGPKAEAGETFVVVSYTLKNTSSQSLPLMERPGLALVDVSGQTYAPDDLATPMAGGLMNDPSGMAADLNSNVSAKTKAAWKLDKAAFDRSTWRLVVASDPQLTFSLK